MNIVVLWNAIHLDAALDRFRVGGLKVRDEGVARLSPLGFEYIAAQPHSPQ